MKTLSKLLIVPAIALGLILSGVSYDAIAATSCKNGMCKITKVTKKDTTRKSWNYKTNYKRVGYYGPGYRSYGCGCGYSCGCGCGC